MSLLAIMKVEIIISATAIGLGVINLVLYVLTYRRSRTQARWDSVHALCAQLSSLEVAYGSMESELTFLRDAADRAARAGQNVGEIQDWVAQVAEFLATSKTRVMKLHQQFIATPFSESQDAVNTSTLQVERLSKSAQELGPVLRRKLEELQPLLDNVPSRRMTNE